MVVHGWKRCSLALHFHHEYLCRYTVPYLFVDLSMYLFIYLFIYLYTSQRSLRAFGYLTSTIRQAKMTSESFFYLQWVSTLVKICQTTEGPCTLFTTASIPYNGIGPYPSTHRFPRNPREKNESPAPGERSSYDSEKETAPTIFPKRWHTIDDHRKHHLNIKPMALWPANKSYQATTLNQLLRIVLQHAAYLDVRRWWEVWFRESNLQPHANNETWTARCWNAFLATASLNKTRCTNRSSTLRSSLNEKGTERDAILATITQQWYCVSHWTTSIRIDSMVYTNIYIDLYLTNSLAMYFDFQTLFWLTFVHQDQVIPAICLSLEKLYTKEILSSNLAELHPGRLTSWNLRIHPWKKKIIWTKPSFSDSMLIFWGDRCFAKNEIIAFGMTSPENTLSLNF